MKAITVLILVLTFAGAGMTQTKENSISIDEKIIPVNTQERNALKPINEFCSVENLKVNEKVSFVIFNNLLIGFCCEGCDEAFLRNPKAYLNKLKQKDA